MVLYLIMPSLYEEIILKIIDLPYVKGEDIFAPVVMYGEPKGYRFEMKMTITICRSICEHMKSLEDDIFNTILDEASRFKIDEDFSYLKGRVISVRGIPDRKRPIFTKGGKTEYPKIFEVTFESDLEDAERIGGDTYTKAVFDKVINNVLCRECRKKNTLMAREDAIRKENAKPEWIKRKEKEKIEKEKEKKKDEERNRRLDRYGW